MLNIIRHLQAVEIYLFVHIFYMVENYYPSIIHYITFEENIYLYC